MTMELQLAIDDAEYGAAIRETRIRPPLERDFAQRLALVRQNMEAAGVLNEETEEGKKNLAKLKLCEDKPGILADLWAVWTEDKEKFEFGSWMHQEPYIIHDEAVRIADLIATYRKDLKRFRIAVVMAKSITPVLRRQRLGTATKLPARMTFLSKWDALITLDFEQWQQLSDRGRQRLIHHELQHLEFNRTTGRLQLRTHDFEEFAVVVDLYGLRSESERFSTDGTVADVLERSGAAQLELLEA